MKYLKVALVALLLVTSFGNVQAQDENNPWSVGFGINAVDFYPTNSIPGTTWFDQFVNAEDHYNIIPAISRLTIGRYIDDGFSFEIDGSFNQIDKIGDMEADDLAFWGIDGVVKWSIGSVANLKWWEPYLLVGGGYTWVGDYDTAAFNGGVGMNFWFNDRVGVNIESKLRQTFESEIYAHFQHSASIVFKMGGKDTDGDGIYDKQDACPEEFGLAEFNGCPDTDGDGIIDSKDNCPNVKGTAANKGCPDTDGDGVIDKDDACPKVAGPAANKGCPWPDTDGDGVVDKDDQCPKVAGPVSNNGCPVKLSEVHEKTLKELARTVYFQTGKAVFTPETTGRLDLAYTIIEAYPNSKFAIEGYTDSTGSDAINAKLSQERADAVRNYFIAKGFNADNLTATGFGESNPIESNKTASGRAVNRRVEIKLVK